MTAFMVGIFRIGDDSWKEEYIKRVRKVVAKYGGRYHVRTASEWEWLEGDPPANAFTLIEFPTMERARECYFDPEYQELVELRRTGSEVDMVILQGVDE